MEKKSSKVARLSSSLKLDAEDKYLLQYKITASKAGFKLSKVYLHRLIMKAPKGMVVDHINGDRFDNRKCNLRICTQAENMRNRKPNAGVKYKGVRLKYSRFEARIGVGKKQIFIGKFDTEIEAAMAYNEAAVKFHGEYARLNEI